MGLGCKGCDMPTKIEWVRNPDGTAGETWNPMTGCSHVSDGCRNCFAEAMTARFRKDHKPWTAQNAEYNVRLHPGRLGQPLKWRKPRRVFVNSMSDLFHERVPDVFIAQVLSTMFRAPLHTYQVLTKRSIRMQQLMNSAAFKEQVFHGFDSGHWPPQMLWLGVSCEDQKTFDERVPLLLQTPAAVRWVSLEPLLAPIILDDVGGGGHTALTTEIDHAEDTKLDWVIAGAESGPGARPCHPEWLRSIRDQCSTSGVAFFLKQRGEFLPMSEAKGRGLRWTQRVCEMASGAYYPEWMCRVGKKAAGRELDGRTWDEFPEVKP